MVKKTQTNPKKKKPISAPRRLADPARAPAIYACAFVPSPRGGAAIAVSTAAVALAAHVFRGAAREHPPEWFARRPLGARCARVPRTKGAQRKRRGSIVGAFSGFLNGRAPPRFRVAPFCCWLFCLVLRWRFGARLNFGRWFVFCLGGFFGSVFERVVLYLDRCLVSLEKFRERDKVALETVQY